MDQRASPREQRLDLEHRDQAGDTRQQGGQREHVPGAVDDFGQRHAVPGHLADLVTDQRDRLRRAEGRAAGEAAPGQVRGRREQQPLPFAGRQVHAGARSMAGLRSKNPAGLSVNPAYSHGMTGKSSGWQK